MWRLVTATKPISIDGLYSFYYYEKGKNFYHKGEAHDFWEAIYVDKGEITVITDNGPFLLKQGNITFFKPMRFHSLFSGDAPANFLVTSFQCNSRAMKFFEDKSLPLTNPQKQMLSMFTKEMRTIFPELLTNRLSNKELFAADTENKLMAYQMGLTHLEQFLIELIRKHKRTEPLPEHPDEIENTSEALFVSSVQQYLKSRVYDSVALSDICTHFNVSKSYICRIFKEETGKSVIDYLIDLKIKEAKMLIRKKDYNFTQIAEMLGYSGIHHFTRSFKSKTGMTPSSYEKSIDLPI